MLITYFYSKNKDFDTQSSKLCLNSIKEYLFTRLTAHETIVDNPIN